MGILRLSLVHHAACRLPPLWRRDRGRSSLGRRQAHADQSLHAVLGTMGAPAFLEGNGRGVSHFLGQGFDAVEHVVTWGLEHRELGQIDAIGVDEIQYAKGHKYLTLVYQIDLGIPRLLWVGKERTSSRFRVYSARSGKR